MMEDIGRQRQAKSWLAAGPEHRPVEANAAASTDPVGHAWHACRALIEANQAIMALIGDAASRQQEFAFTMAKAIFSAFPAPVGQAGRFWAVAMAAHGEACRQGLDTMQALAGTSFEAARAHGESR